MSITNTLFNLIYEPVQNEQQKKDNLTRIELLLTYSTKCNEAGINDADLIINFDQVRKVENKEDKVNEAQSVLVAAIEMGKTDVVKLLIQAGVNPNESISTLSPLSSAARKNNVEVVTFLLNSGAELDRNDDTKIYSNALITACYRGDSIYDAMKILLINNANLKLKNAKNKTAEQCIPLEAHKVMGLIHAAESLKNAIESLEEQGDIFGAGKMLHSALHYDQNFVLSYMVKMAEAAVLRGQGLSHNENYYHPHLLRLAIKNIKTNANTFPNFIKDNFSEKFDDLIIALNAYDPSSEYFDKDELIFKSLQDKSKTLKWLEKGTTLEDTKSKMKKDTEFSQAAAIINSSPIYTPSITISQSTLEEKVAAYKTSPQ